MDASLALPDAIRTNMLTMSILICNSVNVRDHMLCTKSKVNKTARLAPIQHMHFVFCPCVGHICWVRESLLVSFFWIKLSLLIRCNIDRKGYSYKFGLFCFYIFCRLLILCLINAFSMFKFRILNAFCSSSISAVSIQFDVAVPPRIAQPKQKNLSPKWKISLVFVVVIV